MSSWKDLYSEVKRRKMEALDKKDVVKAVESHGKILAVEGRYEKPEKVVNHMYASVHETIKPKHFMKKNLNDYDVVLIDAPAGLEYFSRKTGRKVTDLVIVSDPSKMGIHTMKRIIELTKEVELEFQNIWILGNRFSDNLKEILENQVDSINETNVKFLGILPNDEEISKINLVGENLLELSDQSKTYQSAQQLFAKIL